MALGHNVRDSNDFENGAHRSTRNDACTLWGRCHHHRGSAMLTHHLVVNGAVFQRNFGHVAAGFFHCLLHSSRHFFGFSLAHANASVAITNHRQRCESKNTTALDHLGDTIDRDHFFAQTVLRPFSLTLHFRLNFSHLYFRSA